MNSIDFTQAGGLWTYQDTLKFLQDTYSPLLNAITTALGDRIIISGCAITGSQVAPGWLIYNGELLPLEQSALATNIAVLEADSSEQFNDGIQKSVYKVRKAILTNAAVGVPFSSFKQVKYLAAFLNLPTAAGADYSAANDNMLATITALYNLKNELKNQFPSGIISMWKGAIADIPAGWQLCDGTGGTPDLRDKFIIGAGLTYPVGNTGGNKNIYLTIDQLPSHYFYTVSDTANSSKHPTATDTIAWSSNSSNGNQDYDLTKGTSAANIGKTNTIGSNAAIDITPPYYSLAFIMKL